MRKIKDFISHFFILATIFLTIISVYAIWADNAKDLLVKSFSTVALVLFVGTVIAISSRYMHSNEELSAHVEDEQAELSSLEVFKVIRKMTVSLLIGFSTLLAFIGVLSIWEFIKDKSVLDKVLASISCLIFSSIIIIAVCVLRSKRDSFGDSVKNMTPFDVGKVILVALFVVWFGAIMLEVLF